MSLFKDKITCRNEECEHDIEVEVSSWGRATYSYEDPPEWPEWEPECCPKCGAEIDPERIVELCDDQCAQYRDTFEQHLIDRAIEMWEEE